MRITVEPLPGQLPPLHQLGSRNPGSADPGSGRATPAPRAHQPTLPRQPLPPAPETAASPLTGHARRVAQAICEAVVGRRPIGQLSTWATYAVLADVRTWAHRRGRVPGQLTIWSIHVQHPHRRAAEVAVHLAASPRGRNSVRSVALAMRLDRVGGRWVCTAVDAGPQGLVVDQTEPAMVRLLA